MCLSKALRSFSLLQPVVVKTRIQDQMLSCNTVWGCINQPTNQLEVTFNAKKWFLFHFSAPQRVKGYICPPCLAHFLRERTSNRCSKMFLIILTFLIIMMASDYFQCCLPHCFIHILYQFPWIYSFWKVNLKLSFWMWLRCKWTIAKSGYSIF